MATILIVEDNELNRDMLGRRLGRLGYQVLLAVDAKSGMDAAIKQRPNLILMDLRLPDMGGWDATRILKADFQTRHIPIIALTAHAMEGDRQRALAAGCDDYDTKPIDLERLSGKIKLLLSASSQHDATNTGNSASQ